MTGFRTISSDRLIDWEKIDNLPLDINAELNLKADKSTTVNWKALSSNIILTQDDISDWITYKQYSQTEKNKLAWIDDWAEVNNISDVNATDLTDWWDTSLHTHDWRYYTESEVNTLLNWKQDISTLQETVEDIIWTKVKAGTNVIVNYNDTTWETTISSTWWGWTWDMTKSVYDPANWNRQVAFNDELFSWDYDDLSNKPTNLSDFTNDVWYVTTYTTYTAWTNITIDWNNKI